MKVAVISDPHQISAQQIVQLYKHSGVAFITSVANAVILASFLWLVAPMFSIIAWVAAVAMTNALRLFLARAHRQPDPELLIHGHWINRHLLVTAAAGLAWGAAAISLYPKEALPQQIFMILMLGGAAASALPTFAAVPKAYLVYLVCILGPMAARLISEGDAMHSSMAMMIAVFMGTLLLTSRSMHIGLMESLRLHSGFQTLAHIDGLTGVPNRRHFDESLVREWNRARRSNAPLSLIMIDIDHFKGYNDHYGHQEGDTCLRQVARAIVNSSRRVGDLVARYGGEEFVILLYHTTRDDAYAHAEKLRQVIAGLQMWHEGSKSGYVTISLGGATTIPAADGTPDTLLRAADQALYEAKGEGRDRVIWRSIH